MRKFLLSGRGEVSFEMLTPDLTTAIRVSWEAQQKLRKQLLASNVEIKELRSEAKRFNTTLEAILNIMSALQTQLKATLTNNMESAQHLLTRENRLIISVLHDDMLRMMLMLVDGESSDNPKFKYALSKKYPLRIAVIMQAASRQ